MTAKPSIYAKLYFAIQLFDLPKTKKYITINLKGNL